MPRNAMLVTILLGVVTAAAAEPAGKPLLYPFCMELFDSQKRALPEQVALLRELGFEGVGYPLWLDGSLEKNLRTLDEGGLKLFLVYAAVNVHPEQPPYDPALPEAMAKLKGRPVTVCLLMHGYPPGDPRGEESALKTLRTLGDVAAAAGVRIAIYHHTGDWTESLSQALAVAQKVNHPQVGVTFNLCHWLKVEGTKDYRSVLRENAARVFAVTINGAQIGAEGWTQGLIQPLGAGDFNVPELLAVLHDAGYNGPLGLQCYGIPGDAREHLEQSQRVWRQWRAASK